MISDINGYEVANVGVVDGGVMLVNSNCCFNVVVSLPLVRNLTAEIIRNSKRFISIIIHEVLKILL